MYWTRPNCWTLAFPSGLVQFPTFTRHSIPQPFIHRHPWYRARSPEVLTLRCRALAAVRQAAGGSSKVGATEALDAAKLAKQAKLNARGPASHDGDVMRWSHVCFTMVRCLPGVCTVHSATSVTTCHIHPHTGTIHMLWLKRISVWDTTGHRSSCLQWRWDTDWNWGGSGWESRNLGVWEKLDSKLLRN
jgi:hypothetical protein